MNDLTSNGSSEDGGIGSYLLSTATVFVTRMAKLVVGLGVVVAGLLYWKQDSMLYFPEIGGIPRRPSKNPRRYRSPKEHQIPFESHMIKCSDGVSIHAWLLLRNKPNPNQQQSLQDQDQHQHHKRRHYNIPTLIFFHGNAGNIGLRLPNAIQMMQSLNVNILMVEYRGYGESDTVKPTEAGLKLDAEASLRFLLKHPSIDAASIFLFGRSLGGAVAFHLAQYAQEQQLPLAGMIIENTFTNISDMVDQLMPFLAPFKALVLRIGWDSFKIAPSLQVPILYLAGARDELVPHSHMIRLHQSSKTNSRLNQIHIVKDGTHNETWMHGGQEYWNAILNFMNQAGRQTALSTAGVTPTQSQSLGMTMPDTDASSSHTGSSSHIPIMPSNILNIAQETLRTSSTDSTGGLLGEKLPSKKEL